MDNFEPLESRHRRCCVQCFLFESDGSLTLPRVWSPTCQTLYMPIVWIVVALFVHDPAQRRCGPIIWYRGLYSPNVLWYAENIPGALHLNLNIRDSLSICKVRAVVADFHHVCGRDALCCCMCHVYTGLYVLDSIPYRCPGRRGGGDGSMTKEQIPKQLLRITGIKAQEEFQSQLYLHTWDRNYRVSAKFGPLLWKVPNYLLKYIVGTSDHPSPKLSGVLSI